MTSLPGTIDRPLSQRIWAQNAVIGALAVVMTLLAHDWIAGLAILILYAIWHSLRDIAEPPVLALALSTQWVQITSAMFYEAVFGRRIAAMDMTDYRPTVLIGLGCVVAILVGLRVGMNWARKHFSGGGGRDEEGFQLTVMVPLYLASVPLLGLIGKVAWDIPGFTEAIFGLSMLRSVVLFLILRKLVFPEFRVGWFVLVVTGEILIGLSGFFAGFREPLFFAALALLERFEMRKAGHWVVITLIGVLTFVISLLWTGIKGEQRQQYDSFGGSAVARITGVIELSSRWVESDSDVLLEDVDRFVDRMWPIKYPALAVNNALATDQPALGGAILGAAIMHVLTPRFLFPNKPALKSDSEMVREFSGVMVAGAESNTSIAFGYAPELFLDLGLPLMFIPIFVYGCVLGLSYTWFLRKIRHRDLAVSVVTVIFWLMLYLFERSLVKTFGLAGTLMFYVGGVGFLLDRYYGIRSRPSERVADQSYIESNKVL